MSDAQQPSEIIDLKHRLLTLRDHAIGAEAAVGAAQVEVEAARAETEAAEARVRLADERAHVALSELVAVKQSQTWRVGELMLSPVAVVRRMFHRR